ncbi:hypothetical protein ACWD7T_04265 [Streptomyces sp. 900116325]
MKLPEGQDVTLESGARVEVLAAGPELRELTMPARLQVLPSRLKGQHFVGPDLPEAATEVHCRSDLYEVAAADVVHLPPLVDLVYPSPEDRVARVLALGKCRLVMPAAQLRRYLDCSRIDVDACELHAMEGDQDVGTGRIVAVDLVRVGYAVALVALRPCRLLDDVSGHV